MKNIAKNSFDKSLFKIHFLHYALQIYSKSLFLMWFKDTQKRPFYFKVAARKTSEILHQSKLILKCKDLWSLHCRNNFVTTGTNFANKALPKVFFKLNLDFVKYSFCMSTKYFSFKYLQINISNFCTCFQHVNLV